MSFTPSVPSSPPGQPVDFTLVIENTRPGVDIVGITVTSGSATFAAQCTKNPFDGTGNWTPVGGGTPISTLIPGSQAQCITTGIIIPNNPPPDTFSLSGNVTVTDGDPSRDLTLPATSAPVTVELPSVSISKTIKEIMRGSQPIYPSDPPLTPAAPGDVITYEIVVTNSGEIPLENVWIVDSLTGPIFLPPGTVLPPTPGSNTLTVTTTYIVPADSPDPLVNKVTVTAQGQGFPNTVSAQNSAAYDIQDSALELTLRVENPATGDPIVEAQPGDTVQYRLTVHNTGSTTLNSLTYINLSSPLITVGTPPAIVPDSLGPDGQITLPTWTYTVQATDPDPLISTIRVRGTGADGGMLVYGQSQVALDIFNPASGIRIQAVVRDPATSTVLRGATVVYQITVTNESTQPICNVSVEQVRRDPDTGLERTVIADVPFSWPGTPGRLEASGDPNAVISSLTTYLVTSEDKDPLVMVFNVTATGACPSGGTPLSDSTSRILDLSDAQVNADLVANVGSDGVAEIGDPLVFTFVAQNVGAVTLDNLSATYCIYHGNVATSVCGNPFDPDKQLAPTTIGSFDNTTGGFTYIITAADADAIPFIAEVTMFGTDNQGNQVSIKAATTVPIATNKISLEISGPQQAVVGDTVPFSFTVTNNSGVTLTDVHVYNLLNKVAEPDVYEEVGTIASISPDAGSNTATGTFNYTIKPNVGISGDVLTMIGRTNASSAIGPLMATATASVPLIPILDVQKTGSATTVAGQEVNYTVTIKNQSVSQNVTITSYDDPVLAHYTVPVSNTDFGFSGVLTPGQVVTGNFAIPQVDPVPDPLVNVFTVNGTRSYDSAKVSGSGTHTVDIGCPIAFSFVVDRMDVGAVKHAVLGEYLQWHVSFTNVSSSPINNITITEQLSFAGPVPANQITWQSGTAGSLGIGQSGSLPDFQKQITNQYYKTFPGAMNDTMTATFSETGGVNSCELSYSYPVFSPISVFKVPDPFLAFTGETVTYDIVVANLMETDDGPYQNYYVTVTDSLLDPKPMPLPYDGPTNPETTSGMMGPGEIITKSVDRVVQPDDPEELTNTIRAEFPDPTDETFVLYVEFQATVFTGNPLKLTKVPSAAKAVPGTRITYDYTVTNVSPYQVTDISLVDDVMGNLLPAGPINLDSGATFTDLTDIPYDIPLDAPNPLVNTVTATGTIHLPDPNNPTRQITSSLKVSVPLEDTDIQITKWATNPDGTDLQDNFPASGPDGMPEVASGSPVRYCFRVENRNSGTSTFVDNIAVQDTMFPTALQSLFEAAVVALPGHSPAESTRLYGQETVTFCTDPVNISQSMGDPLTNTVSLNGFSSAGFATYAQDDYSIDLLGTDILITKLPSQPLAFVGETVIYTITIQDSNAGLPIAISDVTDTFDGSAPLPLDLNLFDWTQSAMPGNPPPVGVLGPGGRATLQIPYVVKNTDPDPLRNVATVHGKLEDAVQPTDWTDVTDSTSATVAITDSQLLVRKTASRTASNPSDNGCGSPGNPDCQMVHYTVAITNVGAVDVKGIVAVDHHFDLSTGTYVDSVYDEAKPGELTKVDLAPSQTAFLYYDLAMPTVNQLTLHPDLDPFINQVTVYGVVFDKNGVPIPPRVPDPTYPDKTIKTMATASVDILQTMVRISKSPVIQATAPGGTVPYNVLISNIGDQTLDHLVFTDVTGAQTVNLDLTCAATCPFAYGPEPTVDGTPNPKNGQPYDPTLGLAPKETLHGMVNVTVPDDWAENQFTNIVEIKGQTRVGQAAVQDRASATIDIRSEGIDVEKLASVASAPVGTVVHYTVRITNVGATPMNRLVISDLAIDGVPSHTVTITGGFPESPEDRVPGPDTATLDPEETYEYSYDHTLTLQDADPYINRVTVAGYTATGSALNVAQAIVDVQGAQVSVEKFVCAGTGVLPTDPACSNVVNMSDGTSHTVTYYLHIFNPGSVAIQNLVVTDNIGTVPPITWPQPNNGLAPDDGVAGSGNDEVTVSYTYNVNPGDPDPLVNLVTVTGQSQAGAPVQASATASLSLVTSDLRLTKTSVAQASRGTDITYTLTVENLGTMSQNITNVQVIDPLSPNGASPIPTCTVATLAPNTSHNCQYIHHIGPTDASPLINTATATGTQNGVTVTDQTSNTVEITSSGLVVTKTASPDIAAVGDTVTFTYVITNTNDVGITGLAVQDSNHPLNEFAPNGWPTYLGPHASEIRTWTHQITAQDPDPYTNTVTVIGMLGVQPITAQATETVRIANGSLVVSNVPDRTFAVNGEMVTFTYTVTNLDASNPVTNLVLSDNLCGGAALMAQLPANPTLTAGSSATVYCTAPAALPGPLASTFVAQGLDLGSPVSDTASAEVPVTNGGLLVVKSADRTTVQPGGTITYTITVTNVGSETLQTFVVNDPLVVGLAPVPPTTLPVGQNFTMTGTYTVPLTNPPSSVNNTITVSAVGLSGAPYSDSDSAAVAVLENPNALLSLTKAASAQQVRPGQPVTYTFTVQNISTSLVSGITLSDPSLAPGDPGGVVNIPDLGPGNRTVITRTVTVPANWIATTYTNTAQVLTNGQMQDTASATVAVELLQLTKVGSPDPVVPGNTVTYTFTVTSFSQGSIPNVSITDPQITGWNTPLVATIPPGTTTAVGQTLVPAAYAQPTFVNTAQLLIGAEVVDTAQATVNVTLTGIDVTIGQIVQRIGSDDLQIPRTGQPIQVTLTLRNTGIQAISTANFTATVNIGGSLPCTPAATPALPAALQPSGQPGDSLTTTCTFMPPIGLQEYKTNGLTRTVTINATGTAGTTPVNDTTTGTFTMVDLQIVTTLTVTPVVANSTKPGDEVTFHITVTNQGASPLGCPAAADPSGQTLDCHLVITLDDSLPGNDANLAALITTLRPTIYGTVLTSGASTSFTTGQYTLLDVTAAQNPVTYTAVATIGYYSLNLFNAGLLADYVVHDDGTADVTIQKPVIDVTLGVQPNPTVSGQSVTYTVTVTNTGAIAVQNLVATYQITQGTASSNGILLVGQSKRPPQQTSGSIALNCPGVATCQAGQQLLLPGQSTTGILSKLEDQQHLYTFRVTVNGDGFSQSGSVTATASAQITPNTSSLATATATTGVGAGTATLDPTATDPTITKTASVAQAQAGAPVVWTITVRNGSTTAMSNVTMQDNVPDTLTIVSATTSRGTLVTAGQVITLTTGAMNPNDTITVTVNTTIGASVTAPAAITNTACAARDGGAQKCATGTVNIGPGASTLPSTGIHSSSSRLPGFPAGVLGFTFFGALMILMSAQVSRRRAWIAVLFLLFAAAIVVGAVIALVDRGGEKNKEKPTQQAVGAADTPVPPAFTALPGETPAAPAATETPQPVLTQGPGQVVMQFPPTPTPYILPTEAGPRYLMIPKLGDQFKSPIPIVALPLTDKTWDVSGLGDYVGWLQGTTWLDPHWGNTVLVAHVQLGFNNPGPFWGLGELKPGDEIVVMEGDAQHRFKVISSEKVNPDDWTVTAPTNGPTLTLITCTEWNNNYGVFSQRMVVRAVPEGQS